jgi:hypothetical protein
MHSIASLLSILGALALGAISPGPPALLPQSEWVWAPAGTRSSR